MQSVISAAVNRHVSVVMSDEEVAATAAAAVTLTSGN